MGSTTNLQFRPRSSEFRESDSSDRPHDHTLGDDLEAINFYGRGPKGYTRSDERIREDVCETLYLHPLVDATGIEVKVFEGLVTLTGTVDSRQAKREAEKSIEHIAGVIDVCNQLRLQEN